MWSCEGYSGHLMTGATGEMVEACSEAHPYCLHESLTHRHLFSCQWFWLQLTTLFMNRHAGQPPVGRSSHLNLATNPGLKEANHLYLCPPQGALSYPLFAHRDSGRRALKRQACFPWSGHPTKPAHCKMSSPVCSFCSSPQPG